MKRSPWASAWLLSLALVTAGCGYNTIQSMDEKVNQAKGQIETQLQRRADPISNLGETGKGVAKPEAPFVVGERSPELVSVLRRAAQRTVARAAPGARADVRVLPPEYEWGGPLGLAGPHQRRNAGVAHGVLMALPPQLPIALDRNARRRTMAPAHAVNQETALRPR
jgi:hypothetical protein